MRPDAQKPVDLPSGWPRAASRLRIRLPDLVPQRLSQRALPWPTLLLRATGIWLATRVGYLALTLFFPLVTGAVGSSDGISTRSESLTSLVRAWTIWDGQWYISIARGGYEIPTQTVFFPLYPLTIRLVAAVIGPHWSVAALIASNLAAVLAFCGIAVLAAQVATPGEEGVASRAAVMLFAAYPLTFFLAAAYSDGLFVGLAALTLLFGLRRRWGWAALFGLLAALCRPVAPAIILPLAWEAFQRYRERRSQSQIPPRQALAELTPALLAMVAPFVSIAIYCGFLWWRFGNPLIFIQEESAWTHFALSPLLSVPLAIFAFAHTPLLTSYQARIFLDLAPVLCGIILTLVAARRAPVALTLYTLSVLYAVTSEPLNSTDIFISGGRYMLAAFPLFILFADKLKRSEWLAPALVSSGVMLQAILALFFLRGGWLV